MNDALSTINDDGAWTDEEDDFEASELPSDGITQNVLSNSIEGQHSARQPAARAPRGSSKDKIEEMEKTLDMLKAISVRRNVPLASIIKTLQDMSTLQGSRWTERGTTDHEPRSYLPEFERTKVPWTPEPSVAQIARERNIELPKYRDGPPVGPLPIVNPKSWKLEDFPEEDPKDWPPERPLYKKETAHPQCGQFLRGNDFLSQSRERCINLQLLQSHLQYLGKNYDVCINSARDAMQSAKEHFSNYPPLAARCCVYIFLGYWKKEQLDKARKWYKRSEACVGAYLEGEYVKDWRLKLFPPTSLDAPNGLVTKQGEETPAASAVPPAEKQRRDGNAMMPRATGRRPAPPQSSFDAPDSVSQESPGGARLRTQDSFHPGVNLGLDSLSGTIAGFQNDYYQGTSSKQSTHENLPTALGGLASQKDSVSLPRAHAPSASPSIRRMENAVEKLAVLRHPTRPSRQVQFFGHPDNSKQPPPGQPFPFQAGQSSATPLLKWDGKPIVIPSAKGDPPPPSPTRLRTRATSASKHFSGPDENRRIVNMAMKSSMEALREASLVHEGHRNGTGNGEAEGHGKKGKKTE